MKILLASLSLAVVPSVALAAAFYLIMHDKDHWGWFIFIAVIACGSAYKEGSK